MRKAFVFRLYPTRAQEAALATCVETHRRLYNRALYDRKAAWETEQRTVRYGDQSASLKTERRTNEYLAKTNYSSCQATLRRLDRAFAAFFRRVKSGETPGYPRFKGQNRFDTVEFPSHGDGCRFFGTSVALQHIGRVKVKQHRPVEGTIKTVSITRKADGWHLVLSCDLGDVTVAPKDGPAIGIDLGLKAFLVTSDGAAVDPPRYYRQAQAKLRRLQRTVARRKKGSTRRWKAVAQLKRLHLHVANQRTDFHHQTALSLVRRYGTVVHEDLNITGIARSRLAKSTHDAGWAQFLGILGHKAEEAGVRLIAVDPRNTSQACSACGVLPVVPKTLRDRVHVCTECGSTADRDHNAARNILRRGMGLGSSLRAPTPAVAGVA